MKDESVSEWCVVAFMFYSLFCFEECVAIRHMC